MNAALVNIIFWLWSLNLMLFNHALSKIGRLKINITQIHFWWNPTNLHRTFKFTFFLAIMETNLQLYLHKLGKLYGCILNLLEKDCFQENSLLFHISSISGIGPFLFLVIKFWVLFLNYNIYFKVCKLYII